jgi:hypothetical protein
MKSRILTIIAALALFACAEPAVAQYTSTTANQGSACGAAPGLGIDVDGFTYGCGNNSTRLWTTGQRVVGIYQGTTATAITTGNFTPLTGPTTQKIRAGTALAGRVVTVHYGGVYTTGAASLLNTEVSLCTVAGCGSGTVVSPTGCVVITTNQANVLANGQFDVTCTFIVATTGAAGTLMAKSTGAYQLGAATSAALSVFADLATALSSAVDLTVDEFVQPQFKFTTSNAGNSATLQYMVITNG